MNVLITGGRAPVALDLARAFHRAGHTVFMAESLRGHLSQPSAAIKSNFIVPAPRHAPDAFLTALRQIIQRHRVDLLLPTCEEVFYIARGMADLPCHVFTQKLDTLDVFHNKQRFADESAARGLRVPETMLITRADDVHQAYARWDTVVFKPVYSRFAARTLIQPSVEAVLSQLTFAEPWVAQQHIAGQQFCSYSVCRRGRVTAHATYPTIFTAGQGATIAFQSVDHPAILEWVQKFVAAFDVTGQVAFDFIQSPSGELFAIECNPRATSGLHLLSKNPRFVESFFTDDLPLLVPPADEACMLGTAMLVYGLPAALLAGHFGAWARTLLNSRDVIFDPADPLPFFLQLRSILAYVRIARKQKISPLEASTYDIEWNGAG